MNEVCVLTRFCSECSDSVAPWSGSYGVVGLYLNLVLSEGVEALYGGLTGTPFSLHVLCPVLPLAVSPPHTQPVSHGLGTAVELGLWKRLEGKQSESGELKD